MYRIVEKFMKFIFENKRIHSTHEGFNDNINIQKQLEMFMKKLPRLLFKL